MLSVFLRSKTSCPDKLCSSMCCSFDISCRIWESIVSDSNLFVTIVRLWSAMRCSVIFVTVGIRSRFHCVVVVCKQSYAFRFALFVCMMKIFILGVHFMRWCAFPAAVAPLDDKGETFAVGCISMSCQ